MAQRGLDAQMEEIARGAGVGVGTVYRHFPTKDALIEALVAEKIRVTTENLREALPHAGRHSVHVPRDLLGFLGVKKARLSKLEQLALQVDRG